MFTTSPKTKAGYPVFAQIFDFFPLQPLTELDVSKPCLSEQVIDARRLTVSIIACYHQSIINETFKGTVETAACVSLSEIFCKSILACIYVPQNQGRI